MPRRVKKKQGASKYPKPKLPEGDEGQNLDQDDRISKLELFLKDFDQQVEERVEQIRSEGQKMINAISNRYSVEFLKMPVAYREMSYREFLKLGGSVSQTELERTDSVVDEMIDSISSKVKSTVKKAPRTAKAKGRRPKARNQLVTVPEAENMMIPPATTGNRTRRAAAMRQEMCTPANWGSATSFQTPMVTPKFDPRLVQTVTRDPKPGEVVMSLQGSPITVQKRKESIDKHLKLPIGSGKVLSINCDSNLDNIEVPDLDTDAVSHLKNLQNALGAIIQFHSKDN